ncbi:Detected protein of confused Function [Hibiscus syriacus]|uniref:Detected protein of confused Function n=1 Tax=Hibiscus syriacus TaxID=106335 RepID=A0A6A2XI47_HIBSY|nr:Detected protein of confused Function [Hibiscus syriacus]
MASTSAVSMALPLTGATQKKGLGSGALFKPLPVKLSRATATATNRRSNGKLEVKALLLLQGEGGKWVDGCCFDDVHGDPRRGSSCRWCYPVAQELLA